MGKDLCNINIIGKDISINYMFKDVCFEGFYHW